MAEITFKVAVITPSAAKITLLVAERNIKADLVITYLVVKITFVVI